MLRSRSIFDRLPCSIRVTVLHLFYLDWMSAVQVRLQLLRTEFSRHAVAATALAVQDIIVLVENRH